MTALTLSFLVFLLPILHIFGPIAEPIPDGKLTVRFLDVGQGDGAFIAFPNGETMLVDGGGRINYGRDGDTFEPDVARIGEIVLSETIWELGYSRIDHLVASHADTDHIQGLVDAAKNFDIGHAYFSEVQGTGPDETELAGVLAEKSVPVTRFRGGEVFAIGDVKVSILHPMAAEDSLLSENDRSLVILLEYGMTRFLLSGDIESTAEARLVERQLLDTVDVIKVAHHGSRTSSSPVIIAATQPRFAVISAGRRSNFGHPHAEVVEAWRKAGANVFATAETGMITVVSDGESITTGSFRP